jgi:hypothetical protein
VRKLLKRVSFTSAQGVQAKVFVLRDHSNSLHWQISSNSTCFLVVSCAGSRMNNQVAVFEEKRSAPVAGARGIFSGSSRSACDIRVELSARYQEILALEFPHRVVWLHESRLAAVAKQRRRTDQRHCGAGTDAHWWGPLPV